MSSSRDTHSHPAAVKPVNSPEAPKSPDKDQIHIIKVIISSIIIIILRL